METFLTEIERKILHENSYGFCGGMRWKIKYLPI